MGDEIHYSRFRKSDHHHFEKHLLEETSLLKSWFAAESFSSQPLTAGYELEAWLIDDQMQPSMQNAAFLALANSPLLSPELAQFNIELNVQQRLLNRHTLSAFHHDLTELWQHCERTAGRLHNYFTAIGILPTLQDRHLKLKNISAMDRYKALNEQVLSQRHGRNIQLSIHGDEHLRVEHHDVMLEAAATSMQIHLQVPQALALRYYNAAIILSAPMVAVSANAPFLFGRQLWHETRIPVFEQAVATGGLGGAASGPIRRVSFGSDYARETLFECFAENIEHYPVLLPVDYSDEQHQLRHLRLHNGTIWRWNRPLIGFDPDGTPHLRIEHRVMSAAPSIADNIANIAFFYGLVHFYASHSTAAESLLSFSSARDNFYRAAQHGLQERIDWPDMQTGKCRHKPLQLVVLDQLLPQAEAGLQQLSVPASQIQYYLEIIEQRVQSRQTGSQWQKAFADKHQHDMRQLMQNYLYNQQSGMPVHKWDQLSNANTKHIPFACHHHK